MTKEMHDKIQKVDPILPLLDHLGKWIAFRQSILALHEVGDLDALLNQKIAYFQDADIEILDKNNRSAGSAFDFYGQLIRLLTSRNKSYFSKFKRCWEGTLRSIPIRQQNATDGIFVPFFSLRNCYIAIAAERQAVE